MSPVPFPAMEDPGEQVAARLPVTDRPAWLAVSALIVLVIAGTLWAIAGQAPDVVQGEGMIVPANGFVDLGRDVDGTVLDVRVDPGDRVEQGSPVADVRTDQGDVVVSSQLDGVVATVLVREGGLSGPGNAIMTIDPQRDADVISAFLPVTTGAKVEVGMPARVALPAFPEAQYGTMIGTVASLSTLPVTEDRIALLVGGNDSLAAYFGKSGPVLEATIELQSDPDAPTGYAWTIGHGPDTELKTGTLVQLNVIIAEASPLDRIIR